MGKLAGPLEQIKAIAFKKKKNQQSSLKNVLSEAVKMINLDS